MGKQENYATDRAYTYFPPQLLELLAAAATPPHPLPPTTHRPPPTSPTMWKSLSSFYLQKRMANKES